MKDFEPFQATEFERQLLAAGAQDEPAPGLSARVVAAVGVGGGILATSSVASGSGAIGLTIIKAVGAGFATGLLLTAGAHEVIRLSSHPAPAAISSSQPNASPRTSSSPVTATHIPEPTTSLDLVPIDPVESATPVSRSHLSTPRELHTEVRRTAQPPLNAAAVDRTAEDPSSLALVRGDSALTEEVRALDEARRALREAEPSRALTVLERSRYGVLAAEAAVLRVEALLQLGQRAAAEREAAPILARNPAGLHATRVRALLRRAEGD
jgi:hypothetical protein